MPRDAKVAGPGEVPVTGLRGAGALHADGTGCDDKDRLRKEGKPSEPRAAIAAGQGAGNWGTARDRATLNLLASIDDGRPPVHDRQNNDPTEQEGSYSEQCACRFFTTCN
jgi:hypothetical protein